MLRYLSANIICSERRTVFRDHSSSKTELRETDNVQGQISENSFAPNRDYRIIIILEIFYATRRVLKIGVYFRVSPG